MSELRRDRSCGRQTIVAPDRARRPHRPGGDAAGCPFCPGNEAALPPILAETPGPTPPGWRTRVVANKYPLLTPTAGGRVAREGPFTRRPGRGRHEVIIEHPDHHGDLATLPPEAVAAVIATWRDRAAAALAAPGVKSVIVFRNHGAEAGASLGHPHSQLVAMTAVPPAVRARAAAARRHYRREGQCLVCARIAQERAAGARLVADAGGFVAWVPFAPAAPFELWLAPRRHQARFAAIAPDEIKGLAALLGRLLAAYRHRLDDPEYNLVVNDAPRGHAAAPALHWWLGIVPRRGRPAGFELGSGVAVTPSRPEDDAALLAAYLASASA